jgi:hypothetical protein
MASAARFFLKVYDLFGTKYRQTIPADLVLSVPRIIREINKPASDITVSLALPWDQTGYLQPHGLHLYDLVKVYAQNENYPSGTIVYQGFITEIHTIFNEKQNITELRILPLESILNNAIFTGGNGGVNEDISVAMWAAIQDCMTENGQSIFTNNLQAAGTVTLSASTNFQTHLQWINSYASFMTDTWFWRVTELGRVDLLQYHDVTADHMFTIGGNVESIDLTQSILNMKNNTIVTWKNGLSTETDYYPNAPSQGMYGHRDETIQDQSIIYSLPMSVAVGNANTARKCLPRTQATMVINSKFAIETIRPGDTCEVVNNTNTVAQLMPSKTVYRICRTEYDGVTCKLTLIDVVSNVGVELNKLVGNYTQL